VAGAAQNEFWARQRKTSGRSFDPASAGRANGRKGPWAPRASTQGGMGHGGPLSSVRRNLRRAGRNFQGRPDRGGGRGALPFPRFR